MSSAQVERMAVAPTILGLLHTISSHSELAMMAPRRWPSMNGEKSDEALRTGPAFGEELAPPRVRTDSVSELHFDFAPTASTVTLPHLPLVVKKKRKKKSLLGRRHRRTSVFQWKAGASSAPSPYQLAQCPFTTLRARPCRRRQWPRSALLWGEKGWARKLMSIKEKVMNAQTDDQLQNRRKDPTCCSK